MDQPEPGDGALQRVAREPERHRTRLISHVRGGVKSWGERLLSSSNMAFPEKALGHIPEPLRPGLIPVFEQIDRLMTASNDFDRQTKRLCEGRNAE